MASPKVTEVVATLAAHFAGSEANHRERDLGAKLYDLIGGPPPETDEADADTGTGTDETEQ